MLYKIWYKINRVFLHVKMLNILKIYYFFSLCAKKKVTLEPTYSYLSVY